MPFDENNSMDSATSKPAIHVSVEEDDESLEGWTQRLTATLEKMMFVSGETAEVPTDTTSMIEEIVRQQVIEMVFKGFCPIERCLADAVHQAYTMYRSSRPPRSPLHLYR